MTESFKSVVLNLTVPAERAKTTQNNLKYMSLIQQITDQLKEAMKSKDELKLTTLRGLKAGFVNELVATGKTPQNEITDELALTVLKRQAKQRKDAIEQFMAGGRNDLVEKETKELEIIQSYLPETMSQDDIRKIAEAKKEEMGISDKSQMGQLMGVLMKKLKDKADGGDVKSVVDSLF
jgi:uncharacterized protein